VKLLSLIRQLGYSLVALTKSVYLWCLQITDSR